MSARRPIARTARTTGDRFQAYHHDFKSLPPGLIGHLQATTSSGSPIPNGVKNHTAFTLILPYIEQDAVYREFQPNYASCNAQRCYYTFGGVSNPGPSNLAGGGEVFLHHFLRLALGAASDATGDREQQIIETKPLLLRQPILQALGQDWVQDLRVLAATFAIAGGDRGRVVVQA